MRGGTSRGPFLHVRDLPADQAELGRVLINLMGAGHPLEIDGLGGGNSLTSKVAIIGPPSVATADVDYLFAQVSVLDRRVDFRPNCGNMLSGVGPYAIETGLVEAQGETTPVRIFNVNTQSLVESEVPTPGGKVNYEGGRRISGVPGQAAGIRLKFLDVAGAKTDKLLPTDRPNEFINGIEVTCLDAAVPVVIIDASSLGWRGDELPAVLDADQQRLELLEMIRMEAGRRMGLGNVRESVIPKPILVSKSHNSDATLCVRYFVPDRCHQSLAVTGAIALAASVNTPDTIPNRLAVADGKFKSEDLLSTVRFEHPAGFLDVELEYGGSDPFRLASASIWRTARKIMTGNVFYEDPFDR